MAGAGFFDSIKDSWQHYKEEEKKRDEAWQRKRIETQEKDRAARQKAAEEAAKKAKDNAAQSEACRKSRVVRDWFRWVSQGKIRRLCVFFDAQGRCQRIGMLRERRSRIPD